MAFTSRFRVEGGSSRMGMLVLAAVIKQRVGANTGEELRRFPSLRAAPDGHRWVAIVWRKEGLRMYFELSIVIRRPPADVFAFLRDKDKYPQKPGSPVLVLEQTTPGPSGVGTQYREVVQMLPFVRGEIRSKITRFEPAEHLEEDFEGAGMQGHLAYQFVPEHDGTRLIQRETVTTRGLLRVIEPLIERTLARQLRKRLEAIKAVLESGWPVADQP